jgi:RNA polymerase sigma factor (sigma-70 family)
MASQLKQVIDTLHRVTRPADDAGPSDGQLLESYVLGREESAFAALVERHGPMVWGVCHRVLRCHQDAEDAFQATFLVLVRKAASVVPREMVANWLYGVARQTALKARSSAARRQRREKQVTAMPELESAQPDTREELLELLDQELTRLPDKYRAVIVLCDLEGNTLKEAARRFNLPQGTVASRLATARAMLAKRLSHRGLAVSGGTLSALLAENASANVPASVVSSTVKAATAFAVGQASAAGVLSVKAVALAEGVLKTMLLTRLEIATVVLLAFAILGTGAGALTLHALADKPADHPGKKNQGAVDKPVKENKEKAVKPADDFGAEVKGLRAKVALARAKYVVGDPIVATYRVKNVSKEKQTLWRSGFWPNHLILVRNAERKEPPLTALGQERFRAFSPGGKRDKNSPVEVPPGGEDSAYEKYDLSLHYDLTKPGRYTVQYIYEEKQGGWEGRLPSNESAFEVVAKVGNKKSDEQGGARAGQPEPPAPVQREVPIPTDDSVIEGLGTGPENQVVSQGAVVVEDPRSLIVKDQVRLFTAARTRGLKQKPELKSGANLNILAAGPVLHVPDEAVARRLVRRGNRLDLEVLHTQTDRIDRNVPWQPLVRVPVDIPPGRYTLTVTWRAVESLANAKPLNKPPQVNRFDFVVVERCTVSKVIRIGAVEFQSVADPRCVAPAEGKQSPFEAGLRFTNRGNKELLFNLFRTHTPTLRNAAGAGVQRDHLQDGKPDPDKVPPRRVGAGQSATLFLRGTLVSKPGGLQLHLSDGVGGDWVFSGLRAGKYRLNFKYHNTRKTGLVKGKEWPFLVVEATTEPVELEIVAAKPAEKPADQPGRE